MNYRTVLTNLVNTFVKRSEPFKRFLKAHLHKPVKHHLRLKKNRRRAFYIFLASLIVILFSSLVSAASQNRQLQNRDINRQIKLLQLNATLKEVKAQKTQTEQEIKVRDQKLQDTQKRIDDLNKQLQARNAQKSLLAAISPQTASAAGSHAAWLSAAGIPTSDWSYVDYIVFHESGWRYTAVNYLGATGLCQSLPGVKMASVGADYLTNPVTQLKWCDGYAHSAYHGWANAYAHWQSHRNW